MSCNINLSVNITVKRKDSNVTKRIRKRKEIGFSEALMFGFVFWGLITLLALWVYN